MRSSIFIAHVVFACLIIFCYNKFMKNNKGLTIVSIIFIIIIVLIVGGIAYYAGKNSNTAPTKNVEENNTPQENQGNVPNIPVVNNQNQNNTGKTTTTQTQNNKQEKLPSDVLSLLNKYNINLSKLRKIEAAVDGSYDSIFTYDEKETGYTFSLQKNQTDELGITNIAFDVFYNSLPVFTQSLSLHFSKDRVTANRIYLTGITISPIPKISKTEASKIIESEQTSLKGVDSQLGYYDKNAGKGNVLEDYALVWMTKKNAMVVLDANTGNVIYSWNGIYD